MNRPLRLFAISAIFIVSSVAWAVLGGVTATRGSSSDDSLGRQVSALWGAPQTQRSPEFALVREEERESTREVQRDGRTELVHERRIERTEDAVPLRSTRVAADFHLDRRRKGLVWYALYDVDFDATYAYVHESAGPSRLVVRFTFPDSTGLYDDFVLTVDGVPRPEARSPSGGAVTFELPVEPGQRVSVRVAYRSRGMRSWTYDATRGAVSNLRDFTLRMVTDFHDVDFGHDSLSPTRRVTTARGEELVWRFRQVVTGRTLTLVMPEPIQPGELAAELSFSAPISLFFFFLVLGAVARRRGVDLHPAHFAFLAGAFFAFHLLFAYSVDHLDVEPAFALASVTSIGLVLSYLRVLVSPRFAFVEAGGAQGVYLIGFALAHFARGFTGLTVTMLAILTLFLLMQWSARAERDARQVAARKSAEGAEVSA